jgi:hypothetical protein
VQHRPHIALKWLLVAALLLRALIPVGYMPQRSHGAMHMVACPGHAMAIATDAHAMAKAKACVYDDAVSMSSVDTTLPSLPALAVTTEPVQLQPAAHDGWSPRAIVRSRGPPRTLA